MMKASADSELSVDDRALVEAAKLAIASRFDPDWHVVGAALRLRDGTVVTGVHLEETVGRIAVCAEAVAARQAVDRRAAPRQASAGLAFGQSHTCPEPDQEGAGGRLEADTHASACEP